MALPTTSISESQAIKSSAVQDRDGALLGLKYMFYIAPSVRIGLLLEMTTDLPSIRVTNWPKEISVV